MIIFFKKILLFKINVTKGVYIMKMIVGANMESTASIFQALRSNSDSVTESPVLAILESHDFTQLGVRDRIAQVEIYPEKIIVVNTRGGRSELQSNFNALPKIPDRERFIDYLKNVAIEIKQFNDGEYKLISHVRGVGGCGISNPLHEAVESGNSDEVRHLVENRRYNVNGKTNKGKNRFLTPLYLACEHGHLEIAKFLIEKGANVNSEVEIHLERKRRGEHQSFVGNDVGSDEYVESTPFYVACQNGHINVVKLLIENNTNINKECREYYRTDFDQYGFLILISTIIGLPFSPFVIPLFAPRRKYYENEVIDKVLTSATRSRRWRRNSDEFNFGFLESRTHIRTALGIVVKNHNYPIISLLICHGANIPTRSQSALRSIVKELTHEADIKLLQKGIFSEKDVISELEKTQDSSDINFANLIIEQLGQNLSYYPALAKYMQENFDNKKLLKLEENADKNSDSEPEKTAEEWFKEGKEFFKQQQYNEAIECFDQVLQLETSHYQAYEMRGDAKRGKGDYKGAIEDYEEVKDSLKESNEASAAKHLKKISKKLDETTEQQHEQLKEERRKKDEEELRRRRAEEGERKKQEEQNKLQEITRELEELKLANVSNADLSTLNEKYQALESKVIRLQNPALETNFYVARGNFYYEAALKEGSTNRIKIMYSNAAKDYQQALTGNPFLEGIEEKLIKIETYLKGNIPSISSTFYANESLPKTEDLTPEQLAKYIRN